MILKTKIGNSYVVPTKSQFFFHTTTYRLISVKGNSKFIPGVEFHNRKDQKRFEVSSSRKFHDDGRSRTLLVLFKRF